MRQIKTTISERRCRPAASCAALVAMACLLCPYQVMAWYNVRLSWTRPLSVAPRIKRLELPWIPTRIGTIPKLQAHVDGEDPLDAKQSPVVNATVYGDEIASKFEEDGELEIRALSKATPAINGDFGDQLLDDEGSSVYRIVASSDGKLPTEKSSLPGAIQDAPFILEKLDAIYHAVSHDETRRLKYMERRKRCDASEFDYDEERQLVSVVRQSLEGAGFELLWKRDLDLCEALNAGYLLRLAIAPDVSDFDPGIAREFYPEAFSDDATTGGEEWPFQGRVLIYRRGYSSEVTEGRLLVPKLDYLQASIVQTSAFALTEVLGHLERQVAKSISSTVSVTKRNLQGYLASIVDRMSNESVKTFLRSRWNLANDGLEKPYDAANQKLPFFKLARYGGRNTRFTGSPSISDALAPFLSRRGDGDVPYGMNGLPSLWGESDACTYDINHPTLRNEPGVLVERTSISDIVDLSAQKGRRNLMRRFFSISQLVEPTYEEIVTVWRPLPKRDTTKRKPFVVRPPKFAYDLAEIFEIDDRLPKQAESEPEPQPSSLEIRAYDDVPMANAPAVLPKTRLVFRPADAFVFDLVTILSLVFILSSQRFNSPRLDILAVISVSLWLIRTVLRYSNKLARYDLLVKKFLTSKISYRNRGALKYIARECGTQRATRASLVHFWLVQRMMDSAEPVTRSHLVAEGALNVNRLIDAHAPVRVDIEAALMDLEDLNLIRFGGTGGELRRVTSGNDDVVGVLTSAWGQVFEGKMATRSSQSGRDHSTS